MAKSSINLNIDSELKKVSIELFSNLGLDLSSAVTLFLKESLRVQGLPFEVTSVNSNVQTLEAMNEYYEMKKHPKKYKRYSSFKEVMSDVLDD